MTQQHPEGVSPEAETELIPVAEGLDSTLEIPVVEPGPMSPPTGSPVTMPPPGLPPTSGGAGLWLGRPEGGILPARRPSPLTRFVRGLPDQLPAVVTVAVVAVLAVVTVVSLSLLPRGDGDDDRSTERARPTAAVAPVDPVSITSFDPSGGSGFRSTAQGGWKTQTYRTAEFGNLKSGVGLLLDLGEARALSEVALDLGPGPVGVELRAGDQQVGQASDYALVGSPVTAAGEVRLPATSAGEHQYWLVWVTRLAPSDGGFAALVDDVTVRASTGS